MPSTSPRENEVNSDKVVYKKHSISPMSDPDDEEEDIEKSPRPNLIRRTPNERRYEEKEKGILSKLLTCYKRNANVSPILKIQ